MSSVVLGFSLKKLLDIKMQKITAIFGSKIDPQSNRSYSCLINIAHKISRE